MIGFIAGAVTGAAIAAGYFHFRVKAKNATITLYQESEAGIRRMHNTVVEGFKKAFADLKQSYVKELEELVARPEAELKAGADALLAKAKSIL